MAERETRTRTRRSDDRGARTAPRRRRDDPRADEDEDEARPLRRTTADPGPRRRKTADPEPRRRKTADPELRRRKTADAETPHRQSADSAPRRRASAESENGHAERRPRRRTSSGVDARHAAAAAAQYVAEMTGSRPEGLTSLERTDDGWRIGVEVLESRRIPDSTDILAVYQVDVDRDGSLVSYRRERRYHRGSVDGEPG